MTSHEHILPCEAACSTFSGSLSSDGDVKIPFHDVIMWSTMAMGIFDGSCDHEDTTFEPVENLNQGHHISNNQLPSVS